MTTIALRRALLWFGTIVLVMGVAGYSIFEARRLVEGPKIAILAPVDGSATSSPVVTVSGIAENVSFLSINDRPILTDEEGRFSEQIAPPPGHATLSITAQDRFGRSASRLVHITIVTYCPLSPA